MAEQGNVCFNDEAAPSTLHGTNQFADLVQVQQYDSEASAGMNYSANFEEDTERDSSKQATIDVDKDGNVASKTGMVI